jgi:hypothetical protein
VVNTYRLWICWKIHFQLETLVTVTMKILKKWLAEGRWRRNVLDVLYISRKLGSSLKLGLRWLDRILNPISSFCNFQIHTNVKKNEIEFETQFRLDEHKIKVFLSVFYSFSFTKIKNLIGEDLKHHWVFLFSGKEKKKEWQAAETMAVAFHSTIETA